MIQQIYRHLAVHFKLPMEKAEQVGTTIIPDEDRTTSGTQIVWTFDKHVMIRCHQSYVHQFENLVKDGHALSIAEIADSLSVTVMEQGNFYSITSEDFVAHESPYLVRELTKADQEAFDRFQAQCSEQDRQYGEVSLEDEAIYAVFDSKRIIASASTYEWYGFVDVGVLTDPAYRGQGLGKAVVAAIVKHYLENTMEQRLLLYRHETSNIGSQKIADAVGWQRFATLDSLRFKEIETS